MPFSQKIENIMVPVEDLPLVSEDDLVAQAVEVMRHFFHRQDGTWFSSSPCNRLQGSVGRSSNPAKPVKSV